MEFCRNEKRRFILIEMQKVVQSNDGYRSLKPSFLNVSCIGEKDRFDHLNTLASWLQSDLQASRK